MREIIAIVDQSKRKKDRLGQPPKKRGRKRQGTLLVFKLHHLRFINAVDWGTSEWTLPRTDWKNMNPLGSRPVGISLRDLDVKVFVANHVATRYLLFSPCLLYKETIEQQGNVPAYF